MRTRSPSTDLAISIDDEEAFAVLREEARGRCGGFGPDAIARHVLRVTVGADFPTRQDALAALLRRIAAARRDELTVLARPRGGRVCGAYRVGRTGRGGRGYAVWLASLDPLAGSCACADYGKASLGLCKHLLKVAALGFASARRPAGRAAAPAQLGWDPVRPLTGAGDWLERVEWRDAALPEAGGARVRGLFPPGGGRLTQAWADDLGRRRRVVAALEALLGSRGCTAEPALAPLLAAERACLDRLAAGLPAREVARHLSRSWPRCSSGSTTARWRPGGACRRGTPCARMAVTRWSARATSTPCGCAWRRCSCGGSAETSCRSCRRGATPRSRCR